MPELAEVAIFAQDLDTWFFKQNRKVTAVRMPNRNDGGASVISRKMLGPVKRLVGQRVSFSSQGKALLVSLNDNDQPILEIRLGMTGAFTLKPPAGKWKRHCFLELVTAKGCVYYIDHRRFGRFKEPVSNGPAMAIGGYCRKLGLWFIKKPIVPKISVRRSRICWLLAFGDKTGVGNYMANEALGRAGLSPFIPMTGEQEAMALLVRCGTIAKESFALGGNSFGTGYFRLNGEEGEYSRKCLFYGQPNVPRKLVAGRPVFSLFLRGRSVTGNS